MKNNKGLIIAVIAGVAVAGVVGFLFGTEKGKMLRKKMKADKGKIFTQAADVFSELKEKVAGFKEAKKTEAFSN